MKHGNILLISSFIIEGIFSNFISIHSKHFNPLFLFMAIIIIYPYYKDKRKYYKLCFIYGLLYDIIYTNTLFFHSIIFILVVHIVHYIYKLCSLNLINMIVVTLTSICIYRIISYLLLCLLTANSFSLITLSTSVTSSLVMNIIYMIISYIVIHYIYCYYKW